MRQNECTEAKKIGSAPPMMELVSLGKASKHRPGDYICTVVYL